jgi:hypothetical protein
MSERVGESFAQIGWREGGARQCVEPVWGLRRRVLWGGKALG